MYWVQKYLQERETKSTIFDKNETSNFLDAQVPDFYYTNGIIGKTHAHLCNEESLCLAWFIK